MPSPLNVIALISGGKDSLFSILHCQANGHSVVALANLHPAPGNNDSGDDINSYMYQTVGHSVIPLYAQALGLPLYRREITGTAVDSSRDYAAPPTSPLSQKQRQHDETEDLVPLLQRVMHDHPHANAVSTGAILSTYQRTRVESVALRLGLTPLSYLWQYPLLPPYTQSSLLHDMSAVGQEAIIIKTASGGLDEAFLGLDVAAPASIARLARAMARFGDAGDGAILGEGGEFETLALDGPRPLWKKRIRIHAGPPLLVDGGQTVLQVQASSVEDKTGGDEAGTAAVRIPDLFDDEFARILDILEPSHEEGASVADDTAQCTITTEASHESPAQHLPRNMASETPTAFTYSNLTSDVHAASSPARQLTSLFLRLDHVLQHCNLCKASVNHCTLLLRDMSDFTLLNPIYAQYFTHVNPPARVTVAVGNLLPKGIDVMLSVILDKNPSPSSSSQHQPRQGLHVQGRSYWAPANIGPYSQAISTPLPIHHPSCTSSSSSSAGTLETVYIAGQIPLVPASMEVYTARGFAGQATLSLQHLWRIGRAKHVRCWTAAVALIPSSLAAARVQLCVQTAQQLWSHIHAAASRVSDSHPHNDNDNDDEDIDPWDKLNSHAHTHTLTFNDATPRTTIPSSHLSRLPPPPCFAAQVKALPRAVDIEWSATGLASTSTTSTLELQRERHPETACLSTMRVAASLARFVTLEICAESDVQLLGRLGCGGVNSKSKSNGRLEGASNWATATIYISQTSPYHAQLAAVLRASAGGSGVQWIPCERVWGEDGREVSAVFVGRRDEMKSAIDE
ncbi:hypothetical protein ACJBU6_05331 [Exserohilum turcicum]